MARISEVHLGKISFVRIGHRTTAILLVPVPSAGGRALLVFAAKARSRHRRWWSPTLAIPAASIEKLIEGFRRMAEDSKRRLSYTSRSSGLFLSIKLRGSTAMLALGRDAQIYARVQLRRRDLLRLASTLEKAYRTWPVNELPPVLTWRVKDRIFGPHVRV